MNSRRTFLQISLAAAFAAHPLCAQLKQFETPDADEKGDWSFTPDPTLPNALILGDSISIGYTRQVRSLLQGKANVYRPMNGKNKPINCGDTPMGVESIHKWIAGPKWSVIHFNWGLWDLCYRDPKSATQGHRDKVNGKLTSTIPQYEQNLEKIVAVLERTGAKLIWASTTVVPPDEAGRFIGDDVKYNAAAAKVMAAHHIPIDDLYSLSKTFRSVDFMEPGNVHFLPPASHRLAAKVAASISSALQA